LRKLTRKLVLETASVLALGIAGAVLDYGVYPGDAVADAGILVTGSTHAVSQTSERWLSRDFMRKDDIRWAQLELRYRGLYKGSLDGVLGPETRWALAQFQKRKGLGQTASLDAQTWGALTDNSAIGQGSGMPPDGDRPGTMSNSPAASNLGR